MPRSAEQEAALLQTYLFLYKQIGWDEGVSGKSFISFLSAPPYPTFYFPCSSQSRVGCGIGS
jgi:hypothetical protein